MKIQNPPVYRRDPFHVFNYPNAVEALSKREDSEDAQSLTFFKEWIAINLLKPIEDVGVVSRETFDRRLYPKRPLVGVGVLIKNGERYLLIKRAAEPGANLWTIPGGLVELGEKAVDAARRESFEETGLEIEIIKTLDVLNKIVRDEDSRIKFHFIIIVYLAKVRRGVLTPSSDAMDARWVKADELSSYELTDTFKDLITKLKLH
ncbi:MAG: NUDIX hydrolase [Candidatus Bathyarchaeia archaeon]